MKILENITLYKCDFCPKRLIRKHAMEYHEHNCSSNPKNQSACSGCAFIVEERKDIYYSDPYGEGSFISKTFKCEKLNKKMYPFKAVKMGLVDKYPETFEGEEQMPNECKHWNYTK